jgi:energy-coupling factor transport system permease protein
LLPDRLSGFAVAGSTALNLIPQTVSAITDIREAAAVRGMNTSSPRASAMLFSPVINGGLDRSMQMAEVLESRGFGSRKDGAHALGNLDRVAWMGLLAGGIFAAYGFVSSIAWASLTGAMAAVVGGLIIRITGKQPDVRRTHYVVERFTRADLEVTFAAGISLIGVLVASTASPDTFRYEPYPSIQMPAAAARALAPILFLIAPGFVGRSERNES